MRILYIIDNYSLGGAQTVVRGLMDHNTGKNEKYAIALRRKKPALIKENPNTICFHSSSKYSFRVVRFLKKYIVEKKIEVLHCQLPRSIFVGYLLKRAFPKIKYIIHEQGDVFESWIFALMLRFFKKRADGILACSEATAEMLGTRARIDPRTITVLYNFVDLKRFTPGEHSVFNVKKIAFAGRIEKRKGWREFIQAALIFSEYKDLSFHIAGTGTEENKLLRSLRKMKDANIVYIGFVKDMKAFYQEMDLLVIPSHFEPMGMVAIEAMACGIPVLAANVPGLNEVVEHRMNGWTYPSRSEPGLIRAIEEIMNDDPEELDKITSRAIKYAGAFSLIKFSGRLQKFYASLK